MAQEATAPAGDGAPVAAPSPAASIAATSPVVTLDRERFFQGTRYGRAILAGFEREAAALTAENRGIEAALEAEERALTVRRASLPPDEFAPLAAAFDDKVEDIRATQEAKSRALTQRLEAERKVFFDAALPLLTDVLAERGAVAILAHDAVLLSLSALDITDLAIARMDAKLPEAPAGGAEVQTPEAQTQGEQTPQPQTPDAPPSQPQTPDAPLRDAPATPAGQAPDPGMSSPASPAPATPAPATPVPAAPAP